MYIYSVGSERLTSVMTERTTVRPQMLVVRNPIRLLRLYLLSAVSQSTFIVLYYSFT